ncbi:MAG: hypothetical protein IJ598_02240 [Ruminococcus sp.]|nr:hypothetical protein [Ruminococcus sp.]
MDLTNEASVIFYKKTIPRFYRHTVYMKQKLKKSGADDNMLAAFDEERKKIYSEVKRFIMEEYIKPRRPYEVRFSCAIIDYKICLRKIFERYAKELEREVE